MPQYNIYVSLKNEEVLKSDMLKDETMPKYLARIIREKAEEKLKTLMVLPNGKSACVINLANLIREGK